MKIPVSWLENYVKIGIPIDEYTSKMVMIGNGVEGVEEIGGEIENVVVGHILSIDKHPNADTLLICRVDVGSAVIQVVTGAPNVSAGDWVPVAVHGARLPGGKVIKSGKLRGELSEGMLCSGAELGVPDELYPNCGEEGILIFGEPHAPGEDVRPILGLGDTVVDFEVLANRPDCLSALGIARESAVALGTTSTEPEIAVRESGGDVNDHVKVTVRDADLCMRYCARVVRNIRIAPSPMWMRRALFAAGVRPINNIVDITNYVMLEMGQPMHAFDLKHVRGGHIIVRRAEDGEAIRTLDGKDRVMRPSMLVIADERGATGIAGVMGGEGSEITENTTEVLFEAACFLGASVRVTGRELGMRTESSGRFERGVNVHGVMRALDRAAQLVELLDAGDVVSGAIDVYPESKAAPPIEVSPDYIRRLTGVDIPDDAMLSILSSLRIGAALDSGVLTCAPPDDRQDLSGGADIAEEVLRVYGYEAIPPTLPAGTVQGSRGPRRTMRRRVAALLSGAGLSEIVTYSFQSPKVFDQLLLPADHPLRRCARLLNPLGEDYSVMRTTLLASMLQTMSLNLKRGSADAALFEISACYLPKEVPIADELPYERQTLAVGMTGPGADFYAVKGVVEMLLGALGISEKAEWARSEAPYLHPGRSATLSLGGEAVAEVGEAHPDALEAFEIPARVCVAEIDMERLAALALPMGDVGPLPRHPAVVRDIALVMGEDVPAGGVMAAIEKAAGRLCEKVELFDIYTGASVGEGRKSVAYSVTLRSPDHTLTEEEVAAVSKRILKACEEQFGVSIRA